MGLHRRSVGLAGLVVNIVFISVNAGVSDAMVIIGRIVRVAIVNHITSVGIVVKVVIITRRIQCCLPTCAIVCFWKVQFASIAVMGVSQIRRVAADQRLTVIVAAW